MVKIKDFSRPSSVFQVHFKPNLIFKAFQDSPVYSSTFKPVRTLCKQYNEPISPFNYYLYFSVDIFKFCFFKKPNNIGLNKQKFFSVNC